MPGKFSKCKYIFTSGGNLYRKIKIVNIHVQDCKLFVPLWNYIIEMW